MGALELGAKLCTDAVILIDNQTVSMLLTCTPSANVMEKILQIISDWKQNSQLSQGSSETSGIS